MRMADKCLDGESDLDANPDQQRTAKAAHADYTLAVVLGIVGASLTKDADRRSSVCRRVRSESLLHVVFKIFRKISSTAWLMMFRKARFSSLNILVVEGNVKSEIEPLHHEPHPVCHNPNPATIPTSCRAKTVQKPKSSKPISSDRNIMPNGKLMTVAAPPSDMKEKLKLRTWVEQMASDRTPDSTTNAAL